MWCAVEFGAFCIPGRIGKSGFLRFALAAAILVAHPFAAWSQVVVAPSQVTPQNLRPPPTNAPGGLTVSGAEGLQAPAGAERLNVVVRRFAIEGGFSELEDETRALAQPLEGRRITVAQIYEFANALEQTYARAGYVLVRVTVPPQKLTDRRDVRIVVVDGFIEKVQVDNVAERVRALVAARTASLVGRRHVTLAEIERSLLIAGDVPGLRLKSTLARGETLGGALLVLEGTEQLATAIGHDRRPFTDFAGHVELCRQRRAQLAIRLGRAVLRLGDHVRRHDDAGFQHATAGARRRDRGSARPRRLDFKPGIHQFAH